MGDLLQGLRPYCVTAWTRIGASCCRACPQHLCFVLWAWNPSIPSCLPQAWCSWLHSCCLGCIWLAIACWMPSLCPHCSPAMGRVFQALPGARTAGAIPSPSAAVPPCSHLLHAFGSLPWGSRPIGSVLLANVVQTRPRELPEPALLVGKPGGGLLHVLSVNSFLASVPVSKVAWL